MFKVVLVELSFLSLFVGFVKEFALVLSGGPDHKETESYKEQKDGVAYEPDSELFCGGDVDELPVDIVGLWGLLDEDLVLVPIKLFRVFSLTFAFFHINFETFKNTGLVFVQDFLFLVFITERNEGDSSKFSAVFVDFVF